MNGLSTSRREALLAGAAALAGVASGGFSPAARAEDAPHGKAPAGFRYCLNTSTIRGQKLSLADEVEIAAKAGYNGIEPWIREIRDFVAGGGKLADLRRRIEDHGLTVENAIGFSSWIVDDEAQRKEALAATQSDMELVREIGGTRIAAPPVGATKEPRLDLFQAAARYGDLLRLGEKTGVTPQLELWGFSYNLSRLGELLLVASESGHRRAAVLPDVYHIYKGGSDFAGLKVIAGQSMHVFHINDYPADPPRESIGDGDRVFPGDGVAPLTDILRDLQGGGFQGALSLELFNRGYWERDALDVARTGLEKMRESVARALDG